MTETFDFKKRLYSLVLSGKVGNENKIHLWTGFAYRLEDAEQNARNTMQNIGSNVNAFVLVAHTQVDIDNILKEYQKIDPHDSIKSVLENSGNKPSDKIAKLIVNEAIDKVMDKVKEPSKKDKLMTKIIKGGKRAFNKHKDELTIVERRYLEVKMKIK